MGIHFSRPAATLTSEDLIIVTQQVINEIGDVGGLPDAGTDGSLLVSDSAGWIVTHEGSTKCAGIEIARGQTDDFPRVYVDPYYFSMVAKDGGDGEEESYHSVWLQPDKIAISSPGEGPSEEGTTIERYGIEISNNTSYEYVSLETSISDSHLRIEESYYDDETGENREWEASLNINEMLLYYTNETEGIYEQSFLMHNDYFNIYYESEEYESEIYLRLDAQYGSVFHMDDSLGTVNLYTDHLYIHASASGVRLDHAEGVSFEHYNVWEDEEQQWHYDLIPCFSFTPAGVYYVDGLSDKSPRLQLTRDGLEFFDSGVAPISYLEKTHISTVSGVFTAGVYLLDVGGKRYDLDPAGLTLADVNNPSATTSITNEGVSVRYGDVVGSYDSTTCEVFYTNPNGLEAWGFTADVNGITFSMYDSTNQSANAEYSAEGVYITNNEIDYTDNRVLDLSVTGIYIIQSDKDQQTYLDEKSIQVADNVLTNAVDIVTCNTGGYPALTLTSSGNVMEISPEGILFPDSTVQTTAVAGYTGSFTIDAVTYTYQNGLLTSVGV